MSRAKIVAAVVVIGGALLISGGAYALSIGLSPAGGPPDASYEVTVTCDSQPRAQVRHRDPDYTPGTIPGEQGTERSPGVWTFELAAGDVDDVVFASCGEDRGQVQFDVENPRMYLGPIPANIGQLLDPRTTVEGTDCPSGSQASVEFAGSGGLTLVTADLDVYGDWSTPIPATVQDSDLVVTASCGAITYDPLTIAQRPSATRSSTTTTAASTPVSPPAVPVPGPPSLTG